jgi:hypothetical protein
LSFARLGSPNHLGHRIAAGHAKSRRNFGVTQSGMIPAQRNRASPCRIVADAASLERLMIELKMLTH